MKLNAVGIVVSDMSRSIEFYGRLGLEFPDGADAEGHAEAPLAAGLTLMLDSAESAPSFDPAWTAPQGSPRFAFAVECENPADVDARFAELVAAGASERRAPWDAVWGMRYAMLLDPDGNGIDLYAKL